MKQAPLLDVDPAARRATDFYETPHWMTNVLLDRLPIKADERVLECCAGLGAIARVVAKRAIVVCNEPYQGMESADFRLDATKPESWTAFGVTDWVISNLPFDLADVIAPLALAHVQRGGGYGMALLLRLSWLEPTEARASFLASDPPSGLIILPRHDFRGNRSTDSVTSAWFLFGVEIEPRIQVVTRAERDQWINRARRPA